VIGEPAPIAPGVMLHLLVGFILRRQAGRELGQRVRTAEGRPKPARIAE
jgi:hypothetical protein